VALPATSYDKLKRETVTPIESDYRIKGYGFRNREQRGWPNAARNGRANIRNRK